MTEEKKEAVKEPEAKPEAAKPEEEKKVKTLDDVIDAVRELTTAMADMTKEQKSLRELMELRLRSGKF